MTDRELLQRIEQKDDKAFNVLYQRYEKLFYNWTLSRLTDYDLSCDIAQNFWISIWDAPKEIRTNTDGSAKDYLLRRLTYRILKQLQKELHRMEIPDEALIAQKIPGLSYTHIHEEMDVKEVLEFIDGVLQKIPPLTRRIYQLRHIENLTVKETAQALSVSEKTVRNGFSLALSSVRRELTLYYATDDPSKLKSLWPVLLLLL
jgi:RNA polymerase sigma-70 factor (ECF subfamily)